MSVTQDASLETTSVEDLSGVGPKLAKSLESLGITTVGELLRHYPHRYLDLGTKKQIGQLKEGDEATVIGEVKDVQTRAVRRGRLDILTITVFDGTGYLDAIWFNQNYIAGRIDRGMTLALGGKVQWRQSRLQMNAPFFDVVDGRGTEAARTGRIIPVHPSTAKLNAARLRKLINDALDRFASGVSDPLPASLRERYGLPVLREALRQIHFPTDREALRAARKRLVFDELFILQLGFAARKHWFSGEALGIEHKVDGRLLDRFYSGLPWRLTGDQNAALTDIRRDLESPKPMHRLLLGEVGSGKTVVATAAMLMVVEGGRQAALMAPTEVLAEQHFLKLREPLSELGLNVELINGGRSAQAKEAAAAVAAGEVDVVIGTHSLIQSDVAFAALGLAVIDEQHRFGVRQRLELRGKGDNPDLLVLTATPIPRTMAMTLFGDLDVSSLHVRPGGRSVADQIKTTHVPEDKRGRAYELIRKEAKAGRRAYIVCPLVDDSDKLELKSVLREAEHIRKKVFPDLNVGLLHGRMLSSEKAAVMSGFRSGEFDVLVSTTVIEVGIDVPEATVMMIEHAERFGLSQLHQLRGRVGRGEWPSHCVLFADLKTEDSRARIEAITSISDGFELAEVDLEIRGEGQLFGERQSGLPDLKLAKPTKHLNVLEVARREAFSIIEGDPRLERSEHAALKRELRRVFSDSLDWLMSG